MANTRRKRKAVLAATQPKGRPSQVKQLQEVEPDIAPHVPEASYLVDNFIVNS
jgi:hypothetical protein